MEHKEQIQEFRLGIEKEAVRHRKPPVFDAARDQNPTLEWPLTGLGIDGARNLRGLELMGLGIDGLRHRKPPVSMQRAWWWLR